MSIPYTVISGAAEVAAGFLLLFRRTTTLGALIAFPVLLNVVLLNFFYNVGVKISSTHMLLMSVFLLVPVFGRLINVAVLNRAAEPIDMNGPIIERRGWRIASRVAGVVFIGLYLLNGANPSSIPAQWAVYKAVYVTPARSPLYGLYRVESGGPTGWYKVAIEGPGRIAVRMTDDTVQWLSTDYNPANSTVVLNKKVGLASLRWSRPEPGHLVLEGTYKDAPISMQLRRIDQELRLPNSRFEWVSDEVNFNK